MARALGIGVATFVESCSTSNQAEWGRVVVNNDATVDAWTGTSPHGQGHETTWATLIERELGVAPADIRVHFGDTDHFESGTVTGGSRSVQTGGVALTHAAIEVREQARRVVADLLEAKIDDVVYDRANTGFHVRGTPARFIELAVAAQQQPNGCIEAALRYEPTGNTISFGAYLAVVEVDTETGQVDLQRFVAVDDCGTVINHTLVEGQVHGGVAQGIGQALFEDIVYDRDGNILTSNFADYTIPSAAELPDIEALLVETPSPRNVLGAKGVGESGPIGALPAVLSAIVDALTPLGVTFVDMPATPERVWRAIQSARRP
ncbi:MAG TPA: molybdopterin cofactor-binding domain-containing protein [Acidimicrobiales bacterium]|nr:molybdopterin cofactor-binding domain-containing protein [Acidimicrobiales bacterium]